MKFVFGDCFVCEDSETAKKVAFDPRVRMRCVTLDGDTYNPNGILSGGNDGEQNFSILKKVREMRARKAHFELGIRRLELEEKLKMH